MRNPEFTLADRLVKARTTAGLSGQDIAEALDLARTTISLYETGRLIPRRTTLLAWAATTDVPLAWLEHGLVSIPNLEEAVTATLVPVVNAEMIEATMVDGAATTVNLCAARDSNPEPADSGYGRLTGVRFIISPSATPVAGPVRLDSSSPNQHLDELRSGYGLAA